VIIDMQNYFIVKRESSCLVPVIPDQVQQREEWFKIYFPYEPWFLV